VKEIQQITSNSAFPITKIEQSKKKKKKGADELVVHE